MMVILDSTILFLLIHPNAKPPRDPVTEKVVDRCKVRIELLLKTLSEAGTRVLIPTPVLSEVLVRVGQVAINHYLHEITNTYSFKIEAFDQRAAIEVALLTDADLQSGKKLTAEQTIAKVKYDRQIIATAKVNGVKTIYSDDGQLEKIARANGIKVIQTWNLPLPAQNELDLDHSEEQGS